MDEWMEQSIQQETLKKAARNNEYLDMIDRGIAQLESGHGQEHEIIEGNEEKERMQMDERMEQSIQREREIMERVGVGLERTRSLLTYMKKKNVSFDQAYDELSKLLNFPENEREIYRKRCNFWKPCAY